MGDMLRDLPFSRRRLLAGAALLVAALAAVLPAIRAARLPVTEALHYE